MFIVRDKDRFMSPDGRWVTFGGSDPIGYHKTRAAADLVVATFGGEVEELAEPPEPTRITWSWMPAYPDR